MLQKCPESAFAVQKRKFELHHRIQCIQITQGMKFHLKQIILIFQKGYFPSKSRQMIVAITFSVSSLFWEQIWIVLVKRIVLVKGANLNITIEFSIFELLLIPTFLPEQTILSF